MPSMLKRIFSKRSSKVRVKYMGYENVLKHITHVKFHPSVTEVHDEAFKDCTKLKEIVLSEGITKIGNRTFKGCTKLKRVVLNHGLKVIGNDAFANCTSLDSITFPSTVTKIGDRAFKDRGKLKELTHTRSGLNQMEGWDAFRGCCSLERHKIRLDKIAQVSHLKEIENKLDEMGSTIELRNHHIIIPPTEDDDVLLSLKKTFDKICNLLQYYEVKEATTLLEMALWKAKLSQADRHTNTNRDACRMEVPGPAKDLILQYAYRIPRNITACYLIIYIDCSRGKELEIYDVDSSDTIDILKKKILDNKGIPVDKQQLFFDGELLLDSYTFAECNIQTFSTIKLVVIGD